MQWRTTFMLALALLAAPLDGCVYRQRLELGNALLERGEYAQALEMFGAARDFPLAWSKRAADAQLEATRRRWAATLDDRAAKLERAGHRGAAWIVALKAAELDPLAADRQRPERLRRALLDEGSYIVATEAGDALGEQALRVAAEKISEKTTLRLEPSGAAHDAELWLTLEPPRFEEQAGETTLSATYQVGERTVPNPEFPARLAAADAAQEALAVAERREHDFFAAYQQSETEREALQARLELLERRDESREDDRRDHDRREGDDRRDEEREDQDSRERRQAESGERDPERDRAAARRPIERDRDHEREHDSGRDHQREESQERDRAEHDWEHATQARDETHVAWEAARDERQQCEHELNAILEAVQATPEWVIEPIWAEHVYPATIRTLAAMVELQGAIRHGDGRAEIPILKLLRSEASALEHAAQPIAGVDELAQPLPARDELVERLVEQAAAAAREAVEASFAGFRSELLRAADLTAGDAAQLDRLAVYWLSDPAHTEGDLARRVNVLGEALAGIPGASALLQ